jgi:regulator of sigma E protease
MLELLENILWWLVLIGVMVMIHELGHFLAARYFDVKVEAFSFGFGPRLFGFRRGDTDYRVSLVLFGGYVKMAGEQFQEVTGAPQSEDDNNAIANRYEGTINDPRSLLAKPRWQRLIIAFAGPFMNIVLAVGLLTGLFMVKYQKVSDADMEAVIGHVMPDSAAAKAGIQDGDRIVRLDGKPNPTWDVVEMKEIASAFRPMHVTIERNGHRFDTTVTPILSERYGFGYAGWDARGQVQLAGIEPGYPAEKAGLKKSDIIISVNGQPIHSPTKFQELIKNSAGNAISIDVMRAGEPRSVSVRPVWAKLDGPPHWMIGVAPQQKLDIITTKLSFPDALNESLRENGKSALMITEVVKGMVERRMSTNNLTVPIGLGQLAGQEARQGPSAFFMLMSMVSLNLAIFNLLPIPIMDGGTILMLLVEMTMQRDLSLNVKEAVFKVGFVCIMVILAFAIFNDISKMLPQG